MMPSTCSVIGCKNSYNVEEGIQFFQFPLNKPKLLSQWLTVLDRKDWAPKPSSRICNRHFSRHDFDNRANLHSLRLKSNAVPSIFPSPSCLPDEDKFRINPELITIVDHVKILGKRPRESSQSGFTVNTDYHAGSKKLRKNLELIVVAVENPEPEKQSKESSKSDYTNYVLHEDNLRKTPELIEITDPSEISESRKRLRESSVVTVTVEGAELPPVVDMQKEVLQPRESSESEKSLPIDVTLIDQQKGVQKHKKNNISDDSEAPRMEQKQMQQSKNLSERNISVEAEHSMKVLFNEKKNVHRPRESKDSEVPETTDHVSDERTLLQSSEPIEIAVELPESSLGLRKSSESDVAAETDHVRNEEDLRESLEEVVIIDEEGLPPIKMTIDVLKNIEQSRESSDSDVTEETEPVLLESSESDIRVITDPTESPPMKVKLIDKHSRKKTCEGMIGKNLPMVADLLSKRDHENVMASRTTTSSARNKSKLKLVGKTPTRKISHISPKGSPIRMSQRSTKGKCNKMSDFIMFPDSASINTVRLTSIIDNKVPEHKRNRSTRLRRKVVLMNPTVEERKRFTKSDKSEGRTSHVTKKVEADLFSKVTSACKLVVDLGKNTQCLNKREKYLTKTTKVAGKTAVKTGGKKDDPANRSKEPSLKLKNSDKVSRSNVTEGPILSKRSRKVLDEEGCKIEESDVPTATKDMEKDEEEEAIYNAFVKFIREGGLKEKSAEEKEYERMALRIVATIKHLKLLNKFNRSSKKLTVLITSLPLVETNETVVVRKKNTMTNEENEIELHVDISSNSKSTLQNRKIHSKNVSEVVSSQKYSLNPEINPSEYDIIPVTIDVSSESARTPEESIPLLVAHVEPNKEVSAEDEDSEKKSVNLCHDHNYVSPNNNFLRSHESASNATYESSSSMQSSKSKKRNFTKSDVLLRTRALKKIEDFKSTVKKKNEVIKKLREQIRQLKNDKTFRSKLSKKILKNKSTQKIVIKSDPDDELSADPSSQLTDSLDTTQSIDAISEESNEEEEYMDEATAGPPLSPIRYICEPAL